MNLFIDTSNNKLILILEKDNQVIDSLFLDNQLKISDIVLEQIEQFLAKNNLEINNINSFYATKGPGSYTGVRVAITIIKTLKVINNSLNIYLISSLAFQAGTNNCISLIDAKSNKLYIGIYQNKENIIADQLITNDILEDFTKSFTDFELKKDYQELDYINNYLKLKDSFELITDIKKIEPLYIKKYI